MLEKLYDDRFSAIALNLPNVLCFVIFDKDLILIWLQSATIKLTYYSLLVSDVDLAKAE